MKAKNVNNRQQYRQYIEELADVIVGECQECDDIHHEIHMTVDHSRMIMYFSNNIKVLEYSDNEPEEWKHMIDDSSYWKEVIQAMAFNVMRRDLSKELQERDIEF